MYCSEYLVGLTIFLVNLLPEPIFYFLHFITVLVVHLQMDYELGFIIEYKLHYIVLLEPIDI